MTEASAYNPQPPRPAWGVSVRTLKSQSKQRPIVVLPPPATAVISMAQSACGETIPVVKPGQHVRTGEIIGRNTYGTAVHATITGVVTAVEERPVPAREPAMAPCVVLSREDPEQFHETCQPADPFAMSPEELRSRIAAGGIVGLGGALFPTAIKLGPGTRIDLLIINGAECEPWITCDEMLMCERADTVIDGTRIMMAALGTSRAVIATEADMPDARVALRQAISAAGDDGIGIAVVTAKYPAGGERQLIELIAGREVPSGKLPRDVGCVCQNAATAAAVSDLFRRGRPLISRIVTVTGSQVGEAGNFEVRIGTMISELIAQAGGYRDAPERLIMGGPMMGYALPGDELPVTKATNCIVAAAAAELAPPKPEMPCIRCGECVQVCPARLLPHELNHAVLRSDAGRLRELGLADCIECGCCDYVCPSKIPLTERFVVARRARLERADQEAAR
jgi:electron transport complex protein RnfC